MKMQNQDLLRDLNKLKELRNAVNELGGIDALKELVNQTKQVKEEVADKTNDLSFYKTELQKTQQDLQSFKQGLRDEKLNNILQSELTKQGGKFELLESVVKSRLEITGDHNQLGFTIRDKQGNPMLTEDGNQASIEDLLTELKNDPVYGCAFERPTITGSGAQNASAVTGAMTYEKWQSMGLGERNTYAIKHPTTARKFLKK